MKFCQNCGAPLIDGDPVCQRCGTDQRVYGVPVEPAAPADAAETPFEPAGNDGGSTYNPESFESGQYGNMGNMFGDQGAAFGAGMAYEAYQAQADAAAKQAEEARRAEEARQAAQRSQAQRRAEERNEYGTAGTVHYDYGRENVNTNVPPVYNTNGGGLIKKRSFWLWFLLSLVTFGIFGLVYNYGWAKDVETLCEGDGKRKPNYIVMFLLTIVTLGIYGFYWHYQQTERLRETGEAHGITVNDNGIHTLLLMLLLPGVGILVAQYILFDNTNRLGAVYNGEASVAQVNQNASHRTPIIIGIVVGVVTLILATILAVALGVAGWLYGRDHWDPDFNFDYDWDDEEIRDDSFEDPTYIGDEADLGDFHVYIGDAEAIYGGDGEDAVAVHIEFTNNGKETMTPLDALWVRAYQDGNMMMTTWPDDDVLDDLWDAYFEDVAPGETVEFVACFVLEDDHSDIEVYVSDVETNDQLYVSYSFE